MNNPFEFIDARLSNIENLLLEIKHEPLQQNNHFDELITIPEACRVLNVTKNTLAKHTKNGTIPAYGIGSRVMYKRAEVLSSLVRINK